MCHPLGLSDCQCLCHPAALRGIALKYYESHRLSNGCSEVAVQTSVCLELHRCRPLDDAPLELPQQSFSTSKHQPALSTLRNWVRATATTSSSFARAFPPTQRRDARCTSVLRSFCDNICRMKRRRSSLPPAQRSLSPISTTAPLLGRPHAHSKPGEKSEDPVPSWFSALTTYLGYTVLIIFGHLRDFVAKRTGSSRYFGANSKPPAV